MYRWTGLCPSFILWEGGYIEKNFLGRSVNRGVFRLRRQKTACYTGKLHGYTTHYPYLKMPELHENVSMIRGHYMST